MSLVADGPLIQVVRSGGVEQGDARRVRRRRPGRRGRRRRAGRARGVIARRPWPGPWSSTIVPVSAMPTRGAGDDGVDRVELGARRGRRRRRRRRPSRPSPAGTTTGRAPASTAAATRPASSSGRAPLDDGAVVARPARRSSSTRSPDGVGRRSSRRGSRRPARRGDAGQGAPRTRPRISSRALTTLLIVPVLRRCASTRRGTTPPAGPGRSRAPVQARGRPGQPAGAGRPPGSVVRAKRPSTRSAEPGAALGPPSRRGRRTSRPRPSSRPPPASARGRRGGRRRPARAGATSTSGMSMRTGQTSKQAPHSDEA